MKSDFIEMGACEYNMQTGLMICEHNDETLIMACYDGLDHTSIDSQDKDPVEIMTTIVEYVICAAFGIITGFTLIKKLGQKLNNML